MVKEKAVACRYKQVKVKKVENKHKQRKVIACPLVETHPGIYLSITRIYSLSHYYHFLFCPFFLIGNLSPATFLSYHLSAQLLSCGCFALCYLHLYLLSPLHSSPASLFLSARSIPQAKALSHPFHSSPLCHTSFLLLLLLSPTTHSRLLSPAALSTRRDVCVYHTLISADTCSTPSSPFLCLLFCLRHTSPRTCSEEDEEKSVKQNAPVNNLSLYSREPKWSLSS